MGHMTERVRYAMGGVCHLARPESHQSAGNIQFSPGNSATRQLEDAARSPDGSKRPGRLLEHTNGHSAGLDQDHSIRTAGRAGDILNGRQMANALFASNGKSRSRQQSATIVAELAPLTLERAPLKKLGLQLKTGREAQECDLASSRRARRLYDRFLVRVEREKRRESPDKGKAMSLHMPFLRLWEGDPRYDRILPRSIASIWTGKNRK
ncbi:hypothetical protein N658DRAFT_96297 [Parathielavia hyrcaniae]|uniref:Uncharacterized protein n=1 Tax=Parathielavia hyrcaniae TaxID=113614 RepID=A0AAN6PZ60_9PEZI|nr:hypothetical protein N658DRAFT_96297 [Parathielavia hyrcaniae]